MSRFFKLFIAICLCAAAGASSSLFAQNEPLIPKIVKVKVLAEYPHNTSSYTQGLFFCNGIMYESCGQYGQSRFRIVDYKSGNILRQWKFKRKYFVEGSCSIDGNVYVLTWKERTCFLFTLPPVKKQTGSDFKLLGTVTYNTEGWGLTTDGNELIMSDGSSKLYFLDPASFYCRRTVRVTAGGVPVNYLNELEWIDGKIWANVYTSDYIAVINPQTGEVETFIDCKGLLPDKLRTAKTDVLNGIAYNPEDGSIYITGKYWPRLYKISY